jgi:hypothetical protein
VIITNEEFNYLLANPGAPLRNESGTCTLHYATGDHSFVMSGPTGIHILFGPPITDLTRLQAHWSVFISPTY